MIVAGLPIWIVLIIAVLITLVYYIRNRKSWMSHWLVVLTVFAGHFLFFAWGIMIFLIGEIVRYNYKRGKNRESI